MVKNISLSLLSFASAIILSFFVSPMILRNLGDTRFGVWALFGELLTYYGLIDFGVRAAVNNYVGKALAEQDDTAARRYASSAFYGLSIFAVVAFVISVALVMVFRRALVPDDAPAFEVLASACLFLALFCIGLPLETFAAVLVGGRKAYLVSAYEIAGRLVSTALMIAALTISPNLLLLVAAQLTGKLIYWTAITRHTHTEVPQASISLKLASVEDFGTLLGFGSKGAWISVSTLVISRKDVALLTIFHGPQWVATYSFARIVVMAISQACLAITQAVRPHLVYYWARGEYDTAYTIYYLITRYSTYVVSMMAAFLFPYAPDFLRLWIGARFVTGDWWFRTDIVLWLLLSAQLVRMMHSTSWQLLFAIRRHNALVILITVEAMANAALSLLLVQSYGAVGLATALFVPMLFSQAVVLPLIMRHSAGVSVRRWVIDGVSRPLIGAACVAIAGFFLRQWIPPRTWPILLGEAAVLAALALAIGVAFVVRPEDRRRAITLLSDWTGFGPARPEVRGSGVRAAIEPAVKTTVSVTQPDAPPAPEG
jgi:O-antigen/teichoic acid export membrane protein